MSQAMGKISCSPIPLPPYIEEGMTWPKTPCLTNFVQFHNPCQYNKLCMSHGCNIVPFNICRCASSKGMIGQTGNQYISGGSYQGVQTVQYIHD